MKIFSYTIGCSRWLTNIPSQNIYLLTKYFINKNQLVPHWLDGTSLMVASYLRLAVVTKMAAEDTGTSKAFYRQQNIIKIQSKDYVHLSTHEYSVSICVSKMERRIHFYFNRICSFAFKFHYRTVPGIFRIIVGQVPFKIVSKSVCPKLANPNLLSGSS